ncbi:MAG TPA: 16S rRNA (guanine(966)-N(2))-methyltransferase RsmD [Limnochordia bacterium]|nr:16S rRNA (guanine(966)-N(2))-methyltransferase RsmD [Limnochordia bacterium]
MVRVIAGTARGVPLKAPKGGRTRPTADRVKESLFGIIGARVVDADVLDLFAGTGALGIEALSRGARRAVFVESDRQVAAILRQNLKKCRLEEAATLVVKRLPPRSPLPGEWLPFDLVLMDPPYEAGLVAPTLEWLVRDRLVKPGGWVVVEHSVKEEIPSRLQNLSLIRTKAFGETLVTFLESG